MVFLLIKTFTSNDFKYYLKIMEKCRIPSKYQVLMRKTNPSKLQRASNDALKLI